jgi:hypothetical protein
MSFSLLVLAAGMGARYGGLKQIDPMGPHGETLLDYSVYDAVRAGFTRVVFVIRREFETIFREKIGDRFTGVIAVDYVGQELTDLPSGFSVPPERSKPWGTGHAIRAAREVIGENFAAINADDFYGREAYALLASWFKQRESIPIDKWHGAMVSYELRQTLSPHGSVARGLCAVGPMRRLVAVQELTKIVATSAGAENREEGLPVQMLTGREPVSLNFWGFTPQIFAELEGQFTTFLTRHSQELTKEFFIPTVVDEAIRGGRAEIEVLATASPWFGVTYPGDKARVQEVLRAQIEAGAYPEKLWG